MKLINSILWNCTTEYKERKKIFFIFRDRKRKKSDASESDHFVKRLDNMTQKKTDDDVFREKIYHF